MRALDSVASARALYYDFFAGLFLYELLENRATLLLEQIRILKSNPFSESDKLHFELLENTLENGGIREIVQEYTQSFLLPFIPPVSNTPLPKRAKHSKKEGVGGQIMLYLSHYEEGCLNGKALLRARELVRQSSFRLNKKECKESEEHLGVLLLLMRHLLLSQESIDEMLVGEVVRELVLPLGDCVARALLEREDLRFYPSIGALFQSFLEVERGLEGVAMV